MRDGTTAVMQIVAGLRHRIPDIAFIASDSYGADEVPQHVSTSTCLVPMGFCALDDDRFLLGSDLTSPAGK
jgi:hypothetical protein